MPHLLSKKYKKYKKSKKYNKFKKTIKNYNAGYIDFNKSQQLKQLGDQILSNIIEESLKQKLTILLNNIDKDEKLSNAKKEAIQLVDEINRQFNNKNTIPFNVNIMLKKLDMLIKSIDMLLKHKNDSHFLDQQISVKTPGPLLLELIDLTKQINTSLNKNMISIIRNEYETFINSLSIYEVGIIPSIRSSIRSFIRRQSQF